jgi:hypothetical protein
MIIRMFALWESAQTLELRQSQAEWMSVPVIFSLPRQHDPLAKDLSAADDRVRLFALSVIAAAIRSPRPRGWAFPRFVITR